MRFVKTPTYTSPILQNYLEVERIYSLFIYFFLRGKAGTHSSARRELLAGVKSELSTGLRS